MLNKEELLILQKKLDEALSKETEESLLEWLREKRKNQLANQGKDFYCVSSNALVYGNPCRRWCGSEHCLR